MHPALTPHSPDRLTALTPTPLTGEVVVRMPPSPTGHLHLGTARTALFNWLFARRHQGQIIFRWEDTDRERSQTAHEEEILDGLAWLGMDFRTQSDAFYRQTESDDFHREWIRKLWAEDKIFPCFETPEAIDSLRQAAHSARTNFVFWSPWRSTPRPELESKINQGQAFVWRIRTPKGETLTFTDAIRGEISTPSDTLGDFAIARSDGSVLYMLANVLDDSFQGVTHVIRGEDHVSNTPKQVLLYRTIDRPLPVIAHIPLVLDSHKKKLSKRRVEPGVAVLIQDFQDYGFCPEAVVNGLALIGWNPKSEQELFTLSELCQAFDLGGVQAASAQYDYDKMLWLNRQWLSTRLSPERLTADYAQWESPQTLHQHPHFTRALPIMAQKCKTYAEMGTEFPYFFSDITVTIDGLTVPKKAIHPPEAITILTACHQTLANLPDDQFTPAGIKAAIIPVIQHLGLKNGQFLPPFRYSLSGTTPSAGPFDTAAVIGREQALTRLQNALAVLQPHA